MVTLTILGQTVNVLVDTGCSNTIMTTAMVKQLNLIQLTDSEEQLASYV